MFSFLLRATDGAAILHGHPIFLRFLLTATAFESNRHIEFLTFGIVFTFHITLHTSSFQLISCAMEFSYSFSRWYTDFTMTSPSLACGHMIRYLLSVVLSGILRMNFVSVSLKFPRITPSYHSGFCPINSWTLVSSVCPSSLGHSTLYIGFVTTHGSLNIRMSVPSPICHISYLYRISRPCIRIAQPHDALSPFLAE